MSDPDPVPDSYLEGLWLFNAGAYWHAHEQWELCWRNAAEPDATFYKAIIQTAAALVHWKRGNLPGLRRNWTKSRAKLVALPSPMRGIDIRSLISDMDRFVGAGGSEVETPRLLRADTHP